jgi:protein phosphatase
VDRGPFSVATTLYVLTLKCSFPESIFVIRGNHEFESINASGGLMSEVVEEYDSNDLFSALNVVFAQIPIAACVNSEVFCVHGGIGPQLKTVNQIKAIPKPLFGFSGGLADAILWSDPSQDHLIFRESPRGLGYEFGDQALTAFFKSNGLRLLVRGHEQITEGIKTALDGKVTTVFTISSYCGRTDGFAGVLHVRADHTETAHVLPWIPFIVRMPTVAGALPKRSKLSVTPKAAHGSVPTMVAISAMRGRRGVHTVNTPKPLLPRD